MSYKVSVVIERDAHGYYAYSPELEGCQSQGDSLDEVMTNIKEAIELYLETLPDDEQGSKERGQVLPFDILTTFSLTNLLTVE